MSTDLPGLDEYYTNEACLLPEVPHLGRGVFREATIGGPRPGMSDGIYEICYINRGSVEWWIDDNLYEVGPGNVFINKPGEWHGGENAMLHPCEVYWVQIAFEQARPLPSLLLKETRLLERDLAMTHHRFYPALSPIKMHFDSLFDEHRAPKSHSVVRARAALHELIIAAIRDHNQHMTTESPPRSPGIQRAIDWMEERITGNYRFEDAAEVAMMSTGYFYKRFLQEVGFTPNEYRMRRRIHLAKHLLCYGHLPVTEIALMLGFSSSQYFATVFKKLAGVTPTDYRQMMLERTE